MVARKIFDDIYKGFEANKKCLLDPTVLRLLRLVIFVDSKEFDESLEDIRWAKGEDKFFKEICGFMKENYGDKKK